MLAYRFQSASRPCPRVSRWQLIGHCRHSRPSVREAATRQFSAIRASMRANDNLTPSERVLTTRRGLTRSRGNDGHLQRYSGRSLGEGQNLPKYVLVFSAMYRIMDRQMGYKFKSETLTAYLAHKASARLPEYFAPVAMELSEQIRGYDFTETAKDGHINVRMFGHNLEETQSFVDWSVQVWNQTWRSVHRSRKISTDEFLENIVLRDGARPLESLLTMFESWHENPESDDGPYLSLTKYSFHELSEEPFATIGNLCAATGLAVLDQLIVRLKSKNKDRALYELGLAWRFASIARWSNHMEMASYFETESSRERMARAARARHKKSPIQIVKNEIYELWQMWERSLSKYPTAAAFARDMCDKWPDLLHSEVVVARWVREWRKNKAG